MTPNTFRLTVLSLFAAALVFTAPADVRAVGDEDPGENAATDPEPKKSAKRAKRGGFRPKPGLGSPGGTIGGGTRGEGDEGPWVAVLAPFVEEHPALTTKEQPSLFWFISEPPAADAKVRLSISVPRKRPLWQTTVDAPTEAGIQRLDLQEVRDRKGQPVKLEAGVQYTFSVMLMLDEENLDNNPFASCLVERVETPEELLDAAANVDESEMASAYAENGIWFDALAEIDDQIRSNPDDASLREWRAEVLRQEDDPEQGVLSKVADADLAAAGGETGKSGEEEMEDEPAGEGEESEETTEEAEAGA